MEEDKSHLDEGRLKLLLVHVGDEGNEKVIPNIRKLLSVITPKQLTHRPLIIKLLQLIIPALPEKTSIYATFLSLLNVRCHELVEELIHNIIKETLVHHILLGHLLECKLIVKVIVELVKTGVVGREDIIALYLEWGKVFEGDPEVGKLWKCVGVQSLGDVMGSRDNTDTDNTLREELSLYLSRGVEGCGCAWTRHLWEEGWQWALGMNNWADCDFLPTLGLYQQMLTQGDQGDSGQIGVQGLHDIHFGVLGDVSTFTHYMHLPRVIIPTLLEDMASRIPNQMKRLLIEDTINDIIM